MRINTFHAESTPLGGTIRNVHYYFPPRADRLIILADLVALGQVCKEKESKHTICSKEGLQGEEGNQGTACSEKSARGPLIEAVKTLTRPVWHSISKTKRVCGAVGVLEPKGGYRTEKRKEKVRLPQTGFFALGSIEVFSQEVLEPLLRPITAPSEAYAFEWHQEP